MRVLLLYAGGTIGMVRGPDGSFEPSSGFLTDTLRAQSRFHDPDSSSIFSWSSSLAHYAAWTQANHSAAGGSQPGSGTASPAPAPAPLLPAGQKARWDTPPTNARGPLAPAPGPVPGSPTTAGPAFGAPLTVKSSAPHGTSTKHAVSSRLSTESEGAGETQQHLVLQLPTLVTPRMSSGRRVSYAVLEYEPLLDSSEMSLADWTRLAKDIELNYHDFDGFVIVHGTDTAAYTASALSFLLENLGKSVIVTGSQVPLSQLRNDAVENLLGALFLAGNYIIPEVTLFFSSNLYRGSRVSKVSNNALAAFDSPNMKPLARIGINIEVAWELVARPKGLDRLRVHTTMDSNVAVLRLFPGLSPRTIRTFLAPPLRGCVLESYGAGNAPTSADFLDALKSASDRGCVIVNTTQCLQGEVSAIYAVGRKLQSIGVVAGGDMTPEAALAKLAYLLAKPELTTAQVRELMGRSLRGELTVRAAPTFSAAELEAGSSISGLLARVLGRRPTTNDDESPASAGAGGGGLGAGKKEDDGEDVDDEVARAGHVSIGAMQSEVAAAERILLPYLIHRAVVQNDIDALRSHLEAYALLESAPSIAVTDTTAAGTSPILVGSYPMSTAPSLAGAESEVASVGPLAPPAPAAAGPGPGPGPGPEAGAGAAATALDALLPLHTAASAGRTPLVALLLSLGGLSIHLRDACGRTPLFHAARNGHVGCVRVLVGAGARLVRGGEEEGLAEWYLGRCEREEERVCWLEALGRGR
ncbi:hypothetical protein OC835_001403 [Tilletia horrida]|nr:hypothetical protein OC835_001403 [Tilletia horrida]